MQEGHVLGCGLLHFKHLAVSERSKEDLSGQISGASNGLIKLFLAL